jgi:hypothetical protein
MVEPTLIPEEQELADALLLIANKYGKFNDDNTGIWAGYTPASENEELAKIGVKCGNCVFFNAPNECQIIASAVEEGGLCRFAVLPDGAVNASGGTSAPAEVLDMNKIKKGTGPVTLEIDKITADADGYGGECPPATQDIQLNLKNRQNAIENVGYGPLNPAEPNDEFWQDKADKWKTNIQEAKSAVCGNCIFFVRTREMLDCIEDGIGLGNQEAEGSIEAGELGYCNALDFKCASERTCNAWAAGGPVVDEEESMQAAGSGPCWDGYKQVGMKKGKGGKMVPNCVPTTTASAYNVGEDVNVPVEEFFQKPVYSLPEGMKEYAEEAEEDYEYQVDLNTLVPTQLTVNMVRVEDVIDSDKPIKVVISEDGDPMIVDGHHRSVAHKINGNKTIKAKCYKMVAFTATAGSKPAPKKDQIKGSDKNKKGSAKDGKSVNFTAAITKALENKVKEHNEKAPNGRKVTLAKLKAVYRRGAGAFSTSHRPDQNRNSWSMARVNAFLHLVKSGKPKNAKYISDNDLLPKMHPKSTTASAALLPLIASLNFEEPVENESDLDGPWLFD